MARRTEREGPRDDNGRDRPHPGPEGTEREVHLAVIAARWVGSDPPTAQAYARALAQWRQLPGAIVTSATDLGTTAEVTPLGHSDAAEDGLS